MATWGDPRLVYRTVLYRDSLSRAVTSRVDGSSDLGVFALLILCFGLRIFLYYVFAIVRGFVELTRSWLVWTIEGDRGWPLLFVTGAQSLGISPANIVYWYRLVLWSSCRRSCIVFITLLVNSWGVSRCCNFVRSDWRNCVFHVLRLLHWNKCDIVSSCWHSGHNLCSCVILFRWWYTGNHPVNTLIINFFWASVTFL